jgi:hypothetical protein
MVGGQTASIEGVRLTNEVTNLKHLMGTHTNAE